MQTQICTFNVLILEIHKSWRCIKASNNFNKWEAGKWETTLNMPLRPCQFAKLQCSDKIRGWPCYWLFSGQGSSMWHVFAQLTLTGTLVTQHSFYSLPVNNVVLSTNTHPYTHLQRRKITRASQNQIIQSISQHWLRKNLNWVRNFDRVNYFSWPYVLKLHLSSYVILMKIKSVMTNLLTELFLIYLYTVFRFTRFEATYTQVYYTKKLLKLYKVLYR